MVFIRLWTFSSSRTGGIGLMMTCIGTLWTSSTLPEWIDLLSCFLSPVAPDWVDIIEVCPRDRTLIFTRVTGSRKNTNIKPDVDRKEFTSVSLGRERRAQLSIGSPSCQSKVPGNEVHLQTSMCFATGKQMFMLLAYSCRSYLLNIHIIHILKICF